MEPRGCKCGMIESGAFGVCLSPWAQGCHRQVSAADQTLFVWQEQSSHLAFPSNGEGLKVVAQSNVISLLSFLCFRWMCWWIRLIFLYKAQTVFCLYILLSCFNHFQTSFSCCWPISFPPHRLLYQDSPVLSSSCCCISDLLVHGSLAEFVTSTILRFCVDPFFRLNSVCVSMCLKCPSA